MKQATTAGGDSLVAAAAKAEEVTKLVVAVTEALCRDEALEPAHTSGASFDAAVIPLKPVILICAGPVHHLPAEGRADRPWVGTVPIGGDALGGDASCSPGREEEGLGRGHVALLAQHGVEEIAVAVDRPIQIIPARIAADSNVS